jgi:hypothetical protein
MWICIEIEWNEFVAMREEMWEIFIEIQFKWNS